ncbi:metal-dependent hydrolase family protein [Tanticharoenia sakaeratensis]|uniref:Amidohydrolase-related domain-containing protein n=1 Tax=Tanticharoenia sakaeratensis NBRC 103193 TaxID=1231623 RepID=A0A0D6MLC8_9PROT|nr:amidohydrolase family protein [Tanticharoenia sakaeratensis]GAN54479.1 hypothetical protein Tasa_021_060 [Tanticharoenia sakaeratensis NBRC 103193]GBQ24235.1 imidazolonepropionase [Tanticharoenia sakaeratensis NBRC 103193]
MKTFIRCGRLYDSATDAVLTDQTLVLEGERIVHAGPASEGPQPEPGETVVDYGRYLVMPGLSDMHTHLSYGQARSEEEVDLYGSLEYRAIRAVSAGHRMLRAGYTALMDPACAGLTIPALRDAVFTGLMEGPRITAAGRAITSRQGLYDYFPSWVGCPPVSTGELVTSLPEAIETIRRQTKDGVDVIKLAMDGIQGGNSGGLYAAFTQDETTAMVREAKRIGRRVVVHARGAEGALYAARAGVDIIYHASRISDEAIRAAAGEGCSICPSLLLLTNNIQYARPDDPSYDWWPNVQRRELTDASDALRRAYDAKVPFLVGSETGFAITPYGEWSTRELVLMARFLDIPAEKVMRMTLHDNRRLLRGGREFDALSAGKFADFVVFDGDPFARIEDIEDKHRFIDVWKGGRKVTLPHLPPEMPRHPNEDSQGYWNRLYSRETVAGAPSLSAETLLEGLPKRNPTTRGAA